MIDKIKLYVFVPVWMAFTLSQGHKVMRKLELM